MDPSRALRAELEKLRPQVKSLTTENEEFKKTIGELEIKLKEAEGKAASANVVSIPPAVIREFNWRDFWLTAFIAFALGAIATYLLTAWRDKDRVSFRTKWVIKEGGVVHEFKLVPRITEVPLESGHFVAMYQCPRCDEEVLGRDSELRQHARKHPRNPVETEKHRSLT